MSEKRHSKKTLLLGVLLMITAALWGLFRLSAEKTGSICGETNTDRLSYIESFGWDPGIIHTDVCEVRIPAEFDEAYEEYNALQLAQGFDLRRYRAYTVKKYTYDIKPIGGEEPAVPILANLLVLDGEIIGADISSAEADGFVTVLTGDAAAQ